MPDMLGRADLMAGLRSQAAGFGLTVRDDGADGFTGEKESILAKWPLGKRKVAYRMSCRLDEPGHIAHFRDMVREQSQGIPPPTLTVETTTVKGWERSGTHTERGVGGGGSVDYGQVREAFKRAVDAAGWRFDLEGGRMP